MYLQRCIRVFHNKSVIFARKRQEDEESEVDIVVLKQSYSIVETFAS